MKGNLTLRIALPIPPWISSHCSPHGSWEAALSTASTRLYVQELPSTIGRENWNSFRIWVFSGVVLHPGSLHPDCKKHSKMWPTLPLEFPCGAEPVLASTEFGFILHTPSFSDPIYPTSSFSWKNFLNTFLMNLCLKVFVWETQTKTRMCDVYRTQD